MRSFAIKHASTTTDLMQINAPRKSRREKLAQRGGEFLRSVVDMTREEIASLVRAALASVAPESESQSIDPEADFRDQMDLDSMDFLNFVIALHEATGIDVPERDYPQLASLNGCIEYLGARLE
jgi:acyl carrier protein